MVLSEELYDVGEPTYGDEAAKLEQQLAQLRRRCGELAQKIWDVDVRHEHDIDQWLHTNVWVDLADMAKGEE